MNPDIFKQDSVDKIALMIFDDRVYAGSNIREDVTLTETVNSGTDFVIGSACAAQLAFSLLDINQFTGEADLIDREFVYKLGVNTASESVYKIYRQARRDLVLRNGAYWYGGSQKGNLLTIWKEEGGNLIQQDSPEQPEQPVQSMFLWEGKLYCGHSAAPYVTAYQTGADWSLSRIPAALNALQTAQVLDLNRRRSVFHYTGSRLYKFEPQWSSGRVSDYLELTYEFTQIGIFIPREAKKKDDRILSVTAYDRMAYFDISADYVLNNQKYPVTVADFLKSLCAFAGVPLETASFLNADYLIQKNARTQNVTGRQMLQWVAEAAASFARITPEGKLVLQWYTDIDYSIDASHGGPTEYTSLTAADYTTKKVDKLQIKATKNDIGVIVPADDPNKTNLYVIENNPIFYAETDAELRPTAEKIFNAIKDFQYVPYSLLCKGNPLVRAGSAFLLTTAKGEHLRTLVMSKKTKGIKALTDELNATGNAERAVQSNAINQAIQQLRGSIHEWVVDITQFKSSVLHYQQNNDLAIEVMRSDILQNKNEISLRVEKTIFDEQMNQISQDFSQFRITVNGISSTVSSHTGSISELKQTASSLSLNLQNAKGDISNLKASATELSNKITDANGNISKLEQTADGLSSQISDAKGNISTLEQNAGGISWTVKNAGGKDASIVAKANELESQIALKADIVRVEGLLSGRDAEFYSKGSSRSIRIKDGELLFYRGSSTIEGQIWAMNSGSAFGIEYRSALWISKSSGGSSNAVTSWDSSGNVTFNSHNLYSINTLKCSNANISNTVECRYLEISSSTAPIKIGSYTYRDKAIKVGTTTYNVLARN